VAPGSGIRKNAGNWSAIEVAQPGWDPTRNARGIHPSSQSGEKGQGVEIPPLGTHISATARGAGVLEAHAPARPRPDCAREIVCVAPSRGPASQRASQPASHRNKKKDGCCRADTHGSQHAVNFVLGRLLCWLLAAGCWPLAAADVGPKRSRMHRAVGLDAKKGTPPPIPRVLARAQRGRERTVQASVILRSNYCVNGKPRPVARVPAWGQAKHAAKVRVRWCGCPSGNRDPSPPAPRLPCLPAVPARPGEQAREGRRPGRSGRTAKIGLGGEWLTHNRAPSFGAFFPPPSPSPTINHSRFREPPSF